MSLIKPPAKPQTEKLRIGSLYLSPSDQKIITSVYLYLFYANTSLDIQFPPKITSDSRKMNWSEHKSGYGTDPTAHYSGNSGREISIKFEYIVEDDSIGDGPRWNLGKIKNNINLLKGIFTGFKKKNKAEEGDAEGAGGGLLGNNGQVLIKFKYPLITGKDPKTFRVSAVSVEYSDELVYLNHLSDDLTPVSYPVKSTVSVNMTTYGLSTAVNPTADWQLASEFPTLEELWY